MVDHLALPHSSDQDKRDDADEDVGNEDLFDVRALPIAERPYLTEQDAAQMVCGHLADLMRARPTLPPDTQDSKRSWLHVQSGCNLPLWHCAFQGCMWHGSCASDLEAHLKCAHAENFATSRATAPRQTSIYGNMDLYEEAIAIRERDQIPLVGPSVDRRSIGLLTKDYNNKSVRSLICFVCGQIKPQTPGPNSLIALCGEAWFASLGKDTLEVNLGWKRWEQHYGGCSPLAQYGPGRSAANPQGEWCCRIHVAKGNANIEMFGCPEDWQCARGGSDRATHTDNADIVQLCKDCSLPVCHSCRVLLRTAGLRNNVPMALANDNWYGYVQEVIARYDARWIECACASLCWTTLITYQLEEPYGHLMNESMQGPRGRTAARGNVFSFMMPWEDILKNLYQAEHSSVRVALPNDGSVLAVLLRVHIIGGSIDVTKHLKDVHLRVHVVLRMLEELIARGFPGYRHYRMEDIRKRTQEVYGSDESAELIPPEIRAEIERSRQGSHRRNDPAPWDKNATPSEPPSADYENMFRARRPFEIVPQRSSDAGVDVNTAQACALEGFDTLSIQTGSSMLAQWKSEYLCSSNPFTLALPVGGYDLRGAPRWRRPDDAAWVTLADLTAGLPRRVEGQFRRHWVFTPLLWNLYFHERVHRSRHLALRCLPKASEPMCVQEEEATKAAARCYQRLHEGTYIDAGGARRPIRGDTSKLLFAEGTTSKEQSLLRSMHYISSALPGTQEVRRQMGHVIAGAGIVYGSGIFLTISPSERHNALAIRLSRYRRKDPLVAPSIAPDECKWIGSETPALSPEDGYAAMELPEYELRRLISARDPLSAVDAHNIYVRVLLALLLGIRMCPECPHCNMGKNPCQNRFGSNALPQGGVLGRADALDGSNECQKSEGALHFHCKVFVQRAHQHKTLVEIAGMIKAGLLQSSALKAYHNWICNETYPDVAKQEAAATHVEQSWPTYKDDRELGRIPSFLWDASEKPHVLTEGVEAKNIACEGETWLQTYNDAAQYRMERVQHHIHRRAADGSRKPLPACIAPSRPGKCKHEFPMDSRLTPESLLVCPGIAKERGMKVSGQRNVLGAILGRRNSPWLNGTIRAFAATFGCNTDVSPNDRLPITPETHEQSCSKDCIQKVSVASVACKAQRAQALTSGYFSGYIVKAQPIGRYELKKCVDKMHMLRERIGHCGPRDQAVAVARRMLTDLEMKGVLREAQASFNLCANLRPDDVLFQECIRTFMTVSLPGCAFMQRLHLELDGVGGDLSLKVPPTKRPGLIARNGSAPIVDVYGFRGMDPRIHLLSPFEFMMHWGVEPVLPPNYGGGPCYSEWCEGGEEFARAHRHDHPRVRLTPGRHYRVKDFGEDANVIAFSAEDKALGAFRH